MNLHLLLSYPISLIFFNSMVMKNRHDIMDTTKFLFSILGHMLACDCHSTTYICNME